MTIHAFPPGSLQTPVLQQPFANAGCPRGDAAKRGRRGETAQQALVTWIPALTTLGLILERQALHPDDGFDPRLGNT